MKLGVALPVAGAWATPENMTELAREAERLGYNTVWTVQRLLYPVAPRDQYPPILLGGYSPPAIRRAAIHADGYISGNLPLAKVDPMIEHVRSTAEEHGRAPESLQVVGRGTVRLEDEPQGPDRRPLFGTLEEVREDVERYRQTGLTELFIELNFDERIASPDSDPEAGMERARLLMSEPAPGGVRT